MDTGIFDLLINLDEAIDSELPKAYEVVLILADKFDSLYDNSDIFW